MAAELAPEFDPALVRLYGWAGGDGRAGLWPGDVIEWRAGGTLCVRPVGGTLRVRPAGHVYRYLDSCDAVEFCRRVTTRAAPEFAFAPRWCAVPREGDFLVGASSACRVFWPWELGHGRRELGPEPAAHVRLAGVDASAPLCLLTEAESIVLRFRSENPPGLRRAP